MSLRLPSAFTPSAVLDEYDGPCLCTLETVNGELVLAYLYDRALNEDRFLCVPCSSETIRDLIDNRLAIRDAFIPAAVISEFSVDKAGAVDNVRDVTTSFAVARLPAAGIFLDPRQEAAAG